VVAEDIIISFKGFAKPNGNRLLTAVKVAGGMDVALQDRLHQMLFEKADPEHGRIEIG